MRVVAAASYGGSGEGGVDRVVATGNEVVEEEEVRSVSIQNEERSKSVPIEAFSFDVTVAVYEALPVSEIAKGTREGRERTGTTTARSIFHSSISFVNV